MALYLFIGNLGCFMLVSWIWFLLKVSDMDPSYAKRRGHQRSQDTCVCVCVHSWGGLNLDEYGMWGWDTLAGRRVFVKVFFFGRMEKLNTEGFF